MFSISSFPQGQESDRTWEPGEEFVRENRWIHTLTASFCLVQTPSLERLYQMNSPPPPLFFHYAFISQHVLVFVSCLQSVSLSTFYIIVRKYMTLSLPLSPKGYFAHSNKFVKSIKLNLQPPYTTIRLLHNRMNWGHWLFCLLVLK